jgi:hypothetical protein
MGKSDGFPSDAPYTPALSHSGKTEDRDSPRDTDSHPRYLTPLVPNPASGHDPESVVSTPYSHSQQPS